MSGSSGVYSQTPSKWGPELALTPISSESVGYWHSGGERNPWIKMRMAQEAQVNSIKLVDRLDCCPERFERVEVKVGEVSCGVQSYKGSTTYTYTCPANARGNDILIKKLGTTSNWFHINNVEVFVTGC